MKWTANNNYVMDETEMSPSHFHIVADCDCAATAVHIANIHNIHEENVELLEKEEEEST